MRDIVCTDRKIYTHTTIKCNSKADSKDLLHTDLGDKDACIHDSFDVLKPAWALQTF